MSMGPSPRPDRPCAPAFSGPLDIHAPFAPHLSPFLAPPGPPLAHCFAFSPITPYPPSLPFAGLRCSPPSNARCTASPCRSQPPPFPTQGQNLPSRHQITGPGRPRPSHRPGPGCARAVGGQGPCLYRQQGTTTGRSRLVGPAGRRLALGPAVPRTAPQAGPGRRQPPAHPCSSSLPAGAVVLGGRASRRPLLLRACCRADRVSTLPMALAGPGPDRDRRCGARLGAAGQLRVRLIRGRRSGVKCFSGPTPARRLWLGLSGSHGPGLVLPVRRRRRPGPSCRHISTLASSSRRSCPRE